MFERVRRSDASKSTAHLERRTHLDALEETSTERVADARGIDDAGRDYRGDRYVLVTHAHRRAVLAARDDQRVGFREHRLLVEPRLLLDQLELVIVVGRASRAVAALRVRL